MNNKNEPSFIEIVKSRAEGKRPGKDQLLILLLLGVLLLVIAIPVEERADTKEEQAAETHPQSLEETYSRDTVSYEEELERRLEDFLSQVDGVGTVQVLVRVKDLGEQVVEKDRPARESTSEETDEAGNANHSQESEQEEATVYGETEDGRQIPYVVKEYVPEIDGVIVAAQGGDRPVVVQNILEAVQALLQIEVHKIKVLKLK